MKQKMSLEVEKLLDLEAGVDEEEEDLTDDELENELLMQFLDNESIGSKDEYDEVPHQPEIENENEASRVDWEGYLERARMRGARRRIGDESGSHDVEDSMPFVTKTDDYPLWRVACRVGIEYNAMQSLFSTLGERHEVRSIVIRDSIQGFIYIEASMNQELVKLLKITPGIITTKAGWGVKATCIPAADLADVFKMNDESTKFRKGMWVNIRAGLYRDDVGLVIGMQDWCVEVLVVPRLTKVESNPQKRKRSTVRPSPSLFDPSAFPEESYIQTSDDTYRLGSVRIENGLGRKVYDISALDCNVEDIPYNIFTKFLLSRHPAVLDTDIPRPREWKFDIDEQVVILSSRRLSRVTAVYPTYLEVNRDLSPFVDLEVSEDLERVRWNNIQKLIEIGDYVMATGGPHSGRYGWVVSIDGEEAVLNVTEGLRLAPIEEITVFINCLQSAHSVRKGVKRGIDADKPRERRHKWIGRTVIVTKAGHPSKGMTGTVKDVVLSGPEKTSDSIVVEFGGVIRPGLPFEKIVIRAEDVLFVATPIPIETTEEGPRPSTPTDFPEDYSMEDFDVPSEPDHVLLRSCFEGLEVKANVRGGAFESQKERLVQIVKIDDRLLLRTKNQRTIVTLEPTWVTLLHPKAKGDNNLLVFVEGELLGRFCRRIHHRDGYSGPVSIYVAIVERHPNTGDSLSGEEVEAPMDHFAIVSETKAEKDNKNKLMDNLRKKWRGKD